MALLDCEGSNKDEDHLMVDDTPLTQCKKGLMLIIPDIEMIDTIQNKKNLLS